MSKPIIAVIVGIIGTVIILFLAYQVFNLQNQIDKNLNCALAKTITRNIPYASEDQGVYDLEALALIFDDITKAVNENDFWFFPDTPAVLIDETVMIQDFISENNYVKAMTKKYGRFLNSRSAGHLLIDGSGIWNAKKIVENNCN